MRGVLAVCLMLFSPMGFAQPTDMALVTGGSYVPLYGGSESNLVMVNSFYMDVTPVTHEQYLAFVIQYPQWRRSRVPAIFADEHYLRTWSDDTSPPALSIKSPVNNVSWYAAKAYCECQGKRLPTVDEWEYAAMADENSRDARKDSLYNQRIIRGYEARDTHAKTVGQTIPNYWGIKDLHGLVWEWTLDFNSIILPGESRTQDNDISVFCAAGSINATDLMNYSAFMRYALRASLKANFALRNLGFRCVKDADVQ